MGIVRDGRTTISLKDAESGEPFRFGDEPDTVYVKPFGIVGLRTIDSDPSKVLVVVIAAGDPDDDYPGHLAWRDAAEQVEMLRLVDDPGYETDR